MKSILLFLLLIVVTAHADTAVEQAIAASRARVTDSTVEKAALLLHLLNDLHYINESSPDPRYKYTAKFSATPRDRAMSLIKKYSEGSSGSEFAPYDLDSIRTPQEMLEQRIGGSCGTHARVFAKLIGDLGVAQSDIRVVSAVCVEDYEKMCPAGAGAPLAKTYQGGASGHVFVLINFGDKWKLINTTSSPYDNDFGPHANEITKVRNHLHGHFDKKADYEKVEAEAREVIRGFSVADIDAIDFLNPIELDARLKRGDAIVLPQFHNMPESLSQLLVYESVAPDKFLLHKFKDRYKIIASGDPKSDRCRFTLAK